ncbi:unnamed protein product, partial [Ascophyllum nodosum]
RCHGWGGIEGQPSNTNRGGEAESICERGRYPPHSARVGQGREQPRGQPPLPDRHSNSRRRVSRRGLSSANYRVWKVRDPLSGGAASGCRCTNIARDHRTSGHGFLGARGALPAG